MVQSSRSRSICCLHRLECSSKIEKIYSKRGVKDLKFDNNFIEIAVLKVIFDKT